MAQRSMLNGRLVLEIGDITEKKVDVIVNAANSSLLGGSGVDGAIHSKGGPLILQECQAIRKTKLVNGLPTGEAIATKAGNLPASYVIHTVGPVWKGGGADEDQLLSSAYLNSLKLAATLGAQAIAFPAISTGVYGFPKKRAAEIVYKTINEYIGSNKLPEIIYLVFFSQSDYTCFLENHELKQEL